MMRFCLLAMALVLCLGAWAQDDSTSLADAARKTREAKGKSEPAKKVITDENLEGEHGPLPALEFEGPSNVEDIIKAIADYRLSHKPPETEQVVREWYKHYDDILQRLTAQNAAIRSRQEDDRIQPRGYPDDYKKYQEQRLAEIRGAQQDQKLLRENGMTMNRIQNAFYKIKSDLQFKYRLNYDWLKPSNQNW
jgi:hypothetical protein